MGRLELELVSMVKEYSGFTVIHSAHKNQNVSSIDSILRLRITIVKITMITKTRINVNTRRRIKQPTFTATSLKIVMDLLEWIKTRLILLN